MAAKQPAPSGPAPNDPRTFTLDDVAPADSVVVNGETYPLRRSSSLTLTEQARLARAMKRLKTITDKVENGVEPSVAELREYRGHAEMIAAIALEAVPAETIRALSDDSLGQVAVLFFTRAATSGSLARLMRQLAPSSAPISPVSSGSTAATR